MQKTDHNQSLSSVYKAFIVFGIPCLYILSLFIAPFYHALVESIMDMESEFTLDEQISKLVLLFMILGSYLVYHGSSHRSHIILCLAFLFLTTSMYLAESNMINEKASPVFALLGVGGISWQLLKNKKFLALIIFLLGISFIFLGNVLDLIHDEAAVAAVLPANSLELVTRLIPYEERFDTISVTLILVAFVLSFIHYLAELACKSPILTSCFLIALILMAFGNGFIHYQYDIWYKPHAFALVLSLTGFLILIAANEKVLHARPHPSKLDRHYFYIFVFVLTCLLPASYGAGGQFLATALLIWLPCLTYMVVFMYRHHPLIRSDQEARLDTSTG